jgi:hypothetical protein
VADSGGGITLFHNNGDGTSQGVTDRPSDLIKRGMNAEWGDFENDGFQDAYLAGDYGTDGIFIDYA